MSANGGDRHRLRGTVEAKDPSSSPDVTRIVYAGQGSYLVTMKASGGDKRRLPNGFFYRTVVPASAASPRGLAASGAARIYASDRLSRTNA